MFYLIRHSTIGTFTAKCLDDVLPHWTRPVRELLDRVFPKQRIGREGPFREDLFKAATRYNPCRRSLYRTFGPKKEGHYCASARTRSFHCNRKENIGGVKSSSQSRIVCKTTCACPSLSTTKKRSFFVEKDSTLPGSDSNFASVLFTDKPRFILESDSGHTLIWREHGTRYLQSNIVERRNY
ncbi:hypothetical protein AVEN_174727-1 [Araneus ventricosus]|uniref:Uncharacterized protein n=1 Tax=Araneus ventricosus TaxID=182803 RepID=A0A4Y2BMG7_ARAVE|nr:hypothetical protein AVEN_174727-1 [Araneus ventricosus]